MSFKDCIDNAEKEGVISKERAAQLRADYDANVQELSLDFGPEAEAEAARRTFDAAKFEAAERRRRKLLQARVGDRLTKEQAAFRNFKGNEDFGEFLINLIEDVGGKLGGSSVRARFNALRGRAHARMQRVIEAFERDIVTRTRNKVLLRDVVRASFGDTNVSAEAKMLMAAWNDAAEFLRRRFNAAGGNIGKLENWGMPQSHDAIAVRRAGFDVWRAEILPRLDRTRMIDRATGKPFSDQKLELALHDVYESITTGGANKITPTGAASGKTLARRRADERFLIFRSGDNWINYQERFGQRDAFAAMTGHIDELARDVASMEILGPNPTATLRLLDQAASKNAKLKDAKGGDRKISFEDRARGKVNQAWNMWGLFTGEANAPVNGFVARSVRGVRDFLTSSQLGSAALSALTDIQTQLITRRFNGLPQAGQLSQVVNLMLPTSKADTANAVRAGLIADGATQVGLAQARYMGEIDGTGFVGRLADITLRASLLSPWTQAGRWAFGMEFLGAMAARAHRSLDQLKAGDATDQAFARALDRYGLGGAWDEIRSTPKLYEPELGATFLRPEDIAARTDIPTERADFLANRVLEMVQSETEFAVPTASLRARAAITENLRPGGFAGELLRSVAMYKSFPGTITYLIGSRSMAEGARAGTGAGARFAVSAAFGMMLFGALAIQAKQLASGRDPRPMGDGRFWGAAMLQGGGLGLLGDFMFSDVNRFGGGLGQTLSGPVVSAANTARELTIGNATQIAQGDDPRLGRDFVRALRGNTPGGNIWYLRLAYERLMLDELQRWVDPEAESDFRRRERFFEREFGQEYFFPPGARGPERAPDFANALEGAPQ